MIEIFVDGDGCPVKDETYVVATRYGVRVALVANSRLSVPEWFWGHDGAGRSGTRRCR
jgi:uncharacterized protein YaiI (UPF0178 family)